MDSFKRQQDAAELKELRKIGIINDIPAQYGVELPLISLAEVAEFAAKLNDGPWTDEDGNVRNRKRELVSMLSDELKP